jgi:predicted DsbA family dithiol-disulfide isomerase
MFQWRWATQRRDMGGNLLETWTHARRSEDVAMARDQSVRASPTLLFNEGRQALTGNVGYRVIEANVRELLRTPVDQSSWC